MRERLSRQSDVSRSWSLGACQAALIPKPRKVCGICLAWDAPGLGKSSIINPTFHVRMKNPRISWGFAERSSLHSCFYVADELSDILGGGWSGRVNPRRFKSKATSSFGSTERGRVTTLPSVVGITTLTILIVFRLVIICLGVNPGACSLAIARSVVRRQNAMKLVKMCASMRSCS